MRLVRIRYSWLIFILVAAPWAMRARAQDTDWTTCYVNGRDYPRDSCECQGTCGSSSRNNSYSGPSAAEIDAEREREAEQQRLAEAERKLAEQQRLDEERRKQEQEEWERSVAEAAGSLKGVSTDDMGLKGVDDTASFGLKGVSPDEAASNPQFGIKTGALSGSPHSVQGAWRQLHCAAEFAGDAVADLKRIETGQADARELDEIKFVVGQASAVIHGGTVTVDTSTCGGTGPMPVKLTSMSLAHEAPVIDGLLTRTVHDAETYVASRQKADALRQKLSTLKAENPASNAQGPASTSNPAVKPLPAPTGQNRQLSADQQHINEVYREQRENESRKSDYLALLRETQRALNEANSQKISSQSDAEKVEKETQAILAGQFSTSSSNNQPF